VSFGAAPEYLDSIGPGRAEFVQRSPRQHVLEGGPAVANATRKQAYLEVPVEWVSEGEGLTAIDRQCRQWITWLAVGTDTLVVRRPAVGVWVETQLVLAGDHHQIGWTFPGGDFCTRIRRAEPPGLAAGDQHGDQGNGDGSNTHLGFDVADSTGGSLGASR